MLKNMPKIYMFCSESEDKTFKLDCANRKTCEEGMRMGIGESDSSGACKP
jgi:hypothetical protein